MLLDTFLVFVVLLAGRTICEGSIKPRTLSSTRLRRAAESTNYDDFATLLQPILRSRVPGTEGHRIVKEYIIRFFKDIGWDVATDEFEQDTVIGRKPFANIIATANPNAKKLLLLTAHYDSKLMDKKADSGKEFIAATDSAVPCAMMMSVAKNLDLKELKKNNEYTLQMVFFDGEEAFVEWTKDDSIYGSRHLAKVYAEPDASGKSRLDDIEALILLDLIGAKNPKFYSSFATTHRLFERLQRTEMRLGKEGLMNSDSPFFIGGLLPQPLQIEDDHVPFMLRGVPILHVISVPFPECWHKICDDQESIDKDTVHDLLKILQVFFKEMMRA